MFHIDVIHKSAFNLFGLVSGLSKYFFVVVEFLSSVGILDVKISFLFADANNIVWFPDKKETDTSQNNIPLKSER